MQQKKCIDDNSSVNNRENKDRQLFDTIAERYCKKDMNISAIIARRHRLLQTFRFLPKISDPVLLEVGCGCGFAAKYLKGYYSHYVGIDYSKNLISFANKNNSFCNTEFIPINIKDYYNPQGFDIIFMIGVLHHIDHLEVSFSQIIKMLKPGGWFVANEPQSANKIVQTMRKVRSAIDPGYSSDQTIFSESELTKLYCNASLQNIKIVPQGVFSTPFAEVIFKPDFISKSLSKFSVALDRNFERRFGNNLLPVSWNLIAIGQRPYEDAMDE